MVAAAVFFVVGGLGPLSTWLILPLEDRFPRAELGRTARSTASSSSAASEDARVAKGRGAHALE